MVVKMKMDLIKTEPPEDDNNEDITEGKLK